MTNPSVLGPVTKDERLVPTKSPHTREAILKMTAPQGVDDSPTRESLSHLLAAARPRMFAVALRMTRNPDDAEDVVQEAMLKVWRCFGRFEGRAALSTWIHRIVVNAALDRLRARGAAAQLRSRSSDDGRDADGDDELASPAVETPEELVGTAEVSGEVHRVLQSLPPVHRQVLALRELEGESYQSIAEIARCPIGTVMSRLHHARHRLAAEISTNHAHLVPGSLARAA